MKVYSEMVSTSAKGKLKDKNAKVQRSGIKMTAKHAKKLNDMYVNSPRFYVVDEKATKALEKVK